ncbi:MAG: FGGY family carbohydrate kinase [Steroidobacteraceae bacterium]
MLALDQGSHASRAVVFDAAGRECASAEVALATVRRGASEVEHDAQELLASLRAAAERALEAARRAHPGIELIAAGLATQRSTFVACERGSLAPLAPAISWQDRRNAGWLATLQAHAPRVRALTGLPLSAHYGASKMRWCLDHLPPVASAAARGELLLLPLAAWLVGRLTGSAAVDPANAARTLLWDSTTLDWSAELCALFGIDPAWLPPCRPTRAPFGTLRFGASALPLTACTGDQSAVPFAHGTPDPDCAYVNLGTGAFIQRPLPTRPADPEPLIGSILCVDEHGPRYSLEGSVNGAGAAVAWFAGSAGVEESRLWPLLATLADAAPLPLFVNGVGGLGSPWWRPAGQAQFIGTGSLAERFGAVVESIAILVAANLEAMARRHGPLRRVVVTGGLARSDWLCRRLAAAIGLPVERHGTEASARGTAALAAPQLARAWDGHPATRFLPDPPPGLAQRHEQLLLRLATG